MGTVNVSACKLVVSTALRSFFQLRDGNALETMLMPDVICVGTGAHNVCHGKEETVSHIRRMLELLPNKFYLSNEKIDCKELAPGIYEVFVDVNISPEQDDSNAFQMNLCISSILLENDGQFKIQHLHLSSATEDFEEEETFRYPSIQIQKNPQVPALSKTIEKERVILQETDPLTGLLSLDGFEHHARKLIWGNPTRQYAVFRFSIDYFRLINKNYGYDTGDIVLKNIAKNLIKLCQPGELCARVERDVFVLLLRFTNQKTFDKRLYEMRKKLLDPELETYIKPKITFAGGIYLPKPGGSEEIKSMLDKALLARRNAQNSGFNDRYAYYDERQFEYLFYNDTLMEMAPEALRNGEFQLYIQPQIALENLEPVSGEALVRWILADGKIISPGDFIPLFEQNGFIATLDLYLLEQLCKQMRDWLDRGLHPLPIAINQSRKHLQSPNYLNDFCRIVDRYHIPHDLIVFELTESAFADCENQIINLFRRLKTLGFQRAIDDFGSGYASLNLLSKVTADLLKIDRSLISDIESSERCQMILKKIVEIVQDTEMKVLCEGIETKEQSDLLRAMQCSFGQGYYFYRPMPVDQFEERILKFGGSI